jgi:hypothetical protein
MDRVVEIGGQFLEGGERDDKKERRKKEKN